MQEKTRERYARHIGLSQIGEAGQQALLDAHVLIVGMGGLGSPAALYLAAAGIGEMTICDFDRVEMSNLQRQVLHSTADIGLLKTESATVSLLAINPELKINQIDYFADEDELAGIAQHADIIVDCTDNFQSRFGLNRISINTKTPLISGAAIRWEGQITAFDPNLKDSPCYHCLYPDENLSDATCAMEGVVAPLVGVIGTMQAQATINILIGKPSLVGKVLLYDALAMDWHTIKLKKNPTCKICGQINT
ncbi:MAG: molybdopterin-synthase adenylyltransferase MoeB [Arenicellales bacterium]